MENIHFFKEDCVFDLRKLRRHKDWLYKLSMSYGYNIVQLNYIFCSDEYLHEINKQYLNHDTYTDIITFDLREKALADKLIESDIFISIDRVLENSINLNVEFAHELSRVLAHGLLHLVGHNDKTEAQQKEMRLAEEKAIAVL
ncbi:rRNA maturation RNase YbeY [Marivirga sp.]|uniref:rRNA maturation RNase YbeY n=1 Tax=Marivirga sp. TaxID=2018662 RepID=UPI002D7EC627|nr:rRNA maturation RNase YbeY [Marivirga sp.]HET8858460.1 rRNA maturation RNase YbeY [Marivirga sp.]